MPEKRRKTVTVDFNDAGDIATMSIWTTPDAVSGQQGVAEKIDVPASLIHAKFLPRLALGGLIAQFGYKHKALDNPEASDIAKLWQQFAASISDGTWTPGRVFAAADPDDTMLAVAEVTGQPIHVVQHFFEEQLSAVKKDANGEPLKDKGGRVVHVWRRNEFYKSITDNPRKGVSGHTVKQVLARLTEERAKRMRAEARTAPAEAQPSVLDGLFDGAGAEAA